MPAYQRPVGERRLLARDALLRPPTDVAPALLGALLVRDEDGGTPTVVRIVETEAYGQDDRASHSFRGRTPRTEAMFGRAGTLYVYFTYGMHWCANVTTGPVDVGAAVLLRAGVIVSGYEAVRERRGPGPSDRDLLRGPARLAQGLGIDGEAYGVDLLDRRSPLRLERDDWSPVGSAVAAGPRTGVRHAADAPRRFHLSDVPEVSRYVRHPRAAPPAP